MADTFPGPDDILSELTAAKRPPNQMLMPGDMDILNPLSVTPAPGRAPLPSPAGIVSRADVKHA